MDIKRARDIIRKSNISYTIYKINQDGSCKIDYQITNKDYEDILLNSLTVKNREGV